MRSTFTNAKKQTMLIMVKRKDSIMENRSAGELGKRVFTTCNDFKLKNR